MPQSITLPELARCSFLLRQGKTCDLPVAHERPGEREASYGRIEPGVIFSFSSPLRLQCFPWANGAR
jgi:hypothetical protein